MIPNDHPDPFVRLGQLVTTIKRVYASTFYHAAKDYFNVTDYRLEEEKMSVIVQKMVGKQHGTRFYPDFAGVAKSYNFYPVPPQKPLDGIVSVALGLGKTIVDGGVTVRFCPKYPDHLLQFFSSAEALANNQNVKVAAANVEQASREVAIGRKIAFNYRNGARQDYSVSGQNPVDIALQRQALQCPRSGMLGFIFQ